MVGLLVRSCKVRYDARKVWEARRAKDRVGRGNAAKAGPRDADDGKDSNGSKITGPSRLLGDAAGVADAVEVRLIPRLAGLNRTVDPTDEKTDHFTSRSDVWESG